MKPLLFALVVLLFMALGFWLVAEVLISSPDTVTIYSVPGTDDPGAFFGLQRGMPWLFMPKDLAQIALIDHLTAVRTGVEVVFFPGWLATAALPGDRRAKVR